MPRNRKVLSRNEVKELREAFDLFDRNKDGSISLSELKNVLTALNLNVNDSLTERIMKQIDVDGNGSIDFDEFVQVMGEFYDRPATEEELRRAFQCFDIDGSGFITVEELHQILQRFNQQISEQMMNKLMAEIDTDHDGKISFEEFSQIFKKI